MAAVFGGAILLELLPYLELDSLISDVFPLSQAPEAIENVRARRGIKTAIRPDR